MPIGKRPVPGVAKGKSPSWNTESRSYKSQRHTKTPTGSRPVPGVARDTPRPTGLNKASNKRAVKHTSMPAPNRARTTGASRATGGG